MPDLQAGFIAEFMSGLAVNFSIARWSLAGGLLLGLPIAWLRLGRGRVARLAGFAVAPMRTAPAIVVMFFLLQQPANAWPHNADLTQRLLSCLLHLAPSSSDRLNVLRSSAGMA